MAVGQWIHDRRLGSDGKRDDHTRIVFRVAGHRCSFSVRFIELPTEIINVFLAALRRAVLEHDVRTAFAVQPSESVANVVEPVPVRSLVTLSLRPGKFILFRESHLGFDGNRHLMLLSWKVQSLNVIAIYIITQISVLSKIKIPHTWVRYGGYC